MSISLSCPRLRVCVLDPGHNGACHAHVEVSGTSVASGSRDVLLSTRSAGEVLLVLYAAVVMPHFNDRI